MTGFGLVWDDGFRCPMGGELCGRYVADQDRALLLDMRHPRTDSTGDFASFDH